MSDKKLEDVQAGDMVVSDHRGTNPRLVKVDRTTKTQIVIGSTKYRKANGSMVSSDPWCGGAIRMPKDGEVEELQEKARQEAETNRDLAQAKKEAMRGRALGYLQAAQDAMKGQNGADGKPHPLAVSVFQLRDEMEDAERQCGRWASAFENTAEHLRWKSGGDRRGSGLVPFSHQGMFEAHAAYQTHRVLERLVNPLLDAVAEFLGITIKELIAPYAKKEDEP